MKTCTKISVIVPVYNSEPYLRRTMENLIGQTLQDIEIICIDDKSTDNSLEILREYEKRDNRVRVIASKQNSGSAIARNLGLDVAIGEFLGFLDSDDFVDGDFYEKLYARAIETSADVVKAQIITDGVVVGPFSENIAINKFNFNYAFWSAIFRRKLQQDFNIRFLPELRTSQDILFLLQFILRCNRVELVDDTSYYHVNNPDSVSFGFLSVDKMAMYAQTVGYMFDVIQNSDMDREDYLAALKNMLSGLLEVSKRNTREDAKMYICNKYVEIFSQSKYKNDMTSIVDWNCYTYAKSNDPAGLCEYLLNIQTHNVLTHLYKK